MEQVMPPAAGPQAETETVGSLRGLVDVFYRPTELFQGVRNRPRVLIPLLALLIVVAVFFLALGDMLVQMQLEMPQVRNQLELQGMWPPGEQIRTVMRIQTIVGGTLAIVLGPLLTALLALFFGNFVMAGSVSLRGRYAGAGTTGFGKGECHGVAFAGSARTQPRASACALCGLVESRGFQHLGDNRCGNWFVHNI